MRSMRRRWQKIGRISIISLLGLYAFLVAGLMIADRFIQFRSTDDEVHAYYSRKNLPIAIHHYEAMGRQMRYLSTGSDTAKPTLLLIHGAPSSSSYYRHFLSDTALRAAANLLAVDRPGYGYSGFGQPEPDMGRQAAMIAPILDSFHRVGRPIVLVGASYGTPIVGRIAMDYPQLADGLVLIAPAIAPGREKTYAVSYVLESPLFTWAQPRMVHSANVEKFTHKEQLVGMEKRWSEIKAPVIYFQGQKDDLVYTTNADFARENITEAASLSIRMIPNRGHLLVYDEAHRIKRGILEMIDLAGQFHAQRSADQ